MTVECRVAERDGSGRCAQRPPTGRSLYSRPVNAEFNWWLLIVGLVIGAGLVWLVLADSRRRDVDILEREREGEALWIADTLADVGRPVDADDVLEVLRLHADYLAAGPPDEECVEDAALDELRGVMAHPIVHAGDRDGGAA